MRYKLFIMFIFLITDYLLIKIDTSLAGNFVIGCGINDNETEWSNGKYFTTLESAVINFYKLEEKEGN